MAHLKGRALCVNVICYLGPLTIAFAGGSNSLGRRHSCMIRHSTVVQFQPVRSLAIPPARGHTRVGGVAVAK
jgi:hypothetical protein